MNKNPLFAKLGEQTELTVEQISYLTDLVHKKNNHKRIYELNNIEEFEFYEENNLLVIELTEYTRSIEGYGKYGVGVYDLLSSTMIFTTVLPMKDLIILNSNFFSITYGKFTKIINRNGDTVLGYSLETSFDWVATNKGELLVRGDKRFYELNILNEFYTCSEKNVRFDDESCSINARNVLTRKDVLISVDKSGAIKVNEIKK